MKKGKHYSRRNFISKSLGLLGGFIVSSIPNPLSRFVSAYPKSNSDSKIAVISSSELSKDAIMKMVSSAFNEFGGIGSFIKNGMKVVIKPNIAWNSTPERAHNTNPYLVECVARLCKEAGASITIFDRTCNNARLSYKASGIKDAARRSGARIEYIDMRKFVRVKVPGGLSQKSLYVYKPILDADFVINMPIAKHHSSSDLSIAMKNLMGVLGGRRGLFHIDLHKNIVDFNKAIRVDLIICDALRILTKHGPSSGTPADIKETKTIIMGRNPVTVDAYATTLFGIRPSNIEYLSLAFQEGMGEIRPKSMNIHKKSL